MELKEFIKNPLDAYLKAERYINEGSPSGFSEIHTTQGETSPKSACKSFKLPLLNFDGLRVENIGVPKDNFGGNILPVHPDMMNHTIFANLHLRQSDTIDAVPTASGRTVFDYKNYQFIKLAYLDYLGRIVRHMESLKIISAYEVTQQLMNVFNSGRVNSKFSFLREDFGKVAYIPLELFDIKNIEKMPSCCLDRGNYEYGVLFRELRPYPYIEEDEFLIPFFSLFSREFAPGTLEIAELHVPFIIQLFRAQEKSIEKFILEDVLFPLYHTYFDALLLGGIELEAHAQNMLISIDKNLKIKRIVCRDLESAGRDIDLMAYLGIKYTTKVKDYKFNTRKPKDADAKYDKYTTTHSFMFDFKLGEYIVTPLLNTINMSVQSFDLLYIQKQLKAFNEQFISILPHDFFPPDWCSYAAINYERTGQARKYDWHKYPKYR